MAASSPGMTDILTKQRKHFQENSILDIASRKEYLHALRSMLKSNEDEIADAVYKDFGKSYFEVMENEIGLVYSEIRTALKNLKRWARPKRVGTSLSNIPGQSRIYPLPYGNVLIIAPWNYPVQLALIPTVSALAAGNTVILKPSELTANTSSLLAKLINETFPAEVLFVQEGGIEETTELLKLKFDKIFFTGSTKVGRIVMKAAAEHLSPVTLELGGKNPVIVLPDCDIKMTAKRLVWGKFHNGGQACVAPDHVYVHDSIKAELMKEVKKRIEIMFGNDPKNSEALPRIINTANYDRAMQLIDQKKVILGGKGERDLKFIEPTVMDNVERSDKVMEDEVFGPIMPFLSFTDLHNLLSDLRKDPSPLAFYIFTKDIRQAKRIQREFRSGGGMINDTVVHFVNGTTPFGGLGESGLGSYHGKYGFECFTHRKAVLKKPLWFELWVKYPPYTKTKLRIIKTILR